MRGKPVMNHVALTVDESLLQGEKRERLKEFYGQVFGWTEIKQMTKDGKLFVFSLYRSGQFLYLLSGPKPSVMAGPDHFGIEVQTRKELDAMVARAKECKQHLGKDLQIIDIKCDTETPDLRLWNAYVRYLLPCMVEVQFYEDKATGKTRTSMGWEQGEG